MIWSPMRVRPLSPKPSATARATPIPCKAFPDWLINKLDINRRCLTMRVRFWYSLIFLIPIFILTIILMMISLMSPTAGATTTGPTVTPAPITSQNVELIKQMGGSAFAVSAQGNNVYLGNGPSLIVLDVSDPAQPVQIG
ncbi:MAG TPA: hypothetical protein ENJ93_05275, partial [Chloroflexi bacterium]|nr:hypothetical protein [Chloroflexota bacterium]